MNALIYKDPHSRMNSAYAHVRDGVVYRHPYQEITPPNTSDYAIGHVESDGIIYNTPYNRNSVTGSTGVGRVDSKGVIYTDIYASAGSAIAHVSGGYIYSEPYSEMGCTVGQYEGDPVAAAAAWYLMEQFEGESISSGGYASVHRKKADTGFIGPDGVYYRSEKEFREYEEFREQVKRDEEKRQRHKQWLASLTKEERARYYEEQAHKKQAREEQEHRENVSSFFVGMVFSVLLIVLSYLLGNGSDLLFGALMGLVSKVLLIAGIVVALLSIAGFLIPAIRYSLRRKK